MRLIDAEALKKSLQNFFQGLVIKNHENIDEDIFYYIDNAPTIDAFEVVGKENEDFLGKIGFFYRPHGKWICGMKCSVCGDFSSDNGNFCTNCGADMREDSEK